MKQNRQPAKRFVDIVTRNNNNREMRDLFIAEKYIDHRRQNYMYWQINVINNCHYFEAPQEVGPPNSIL